MKGYIIKLFKYFLLFITVIIIVGFLLIFLPSKKYSNGYSLAEPSGSSLVVKNGFIAVPGNIVYTNNDDRYILVARSINHISYKVKKGCILEYWIIDTKKDIGYIAYSRKTFMKYLDSKGLEISLDLDYVDNKMKTYVKRPDMYCHDIEFNKLKKRDSFLTLKEIGNSGTIY